MFSERVYSIPQEQIRHLDISDMERIKRYKVAGYGGNVSDSLWQLGVKDTVLSPRFKALRQGMQLCGRALPVKIHSLVSDEDLAVQDKEAYQKREQERFTASSGHPQKRMMRTVEETENGSILCFDCGGDMQPAQFGEMSSQVAYAHGCRGMLVAGNVRDTQYILKMDDFPVFSFGTIPNAFGGWIITDVNVPIMLPGHITYYVKILPGDFIFGDNDGVQVIPGEIVDEVLLRVEDIYVTENKQRQALAEGMPVDEVYREFGIL